MPHLLLGTKGLMKLRQLFKSKDVTITNLHGYRKLSDPKSGFLIGAYVLSSHPNEQKRTKFEVGYQQKMFDFSKEVWQSLLIVSCKVMFQNCHAYMSQIGFQIGREK